MSELRKDPIVGRWVIIAENRANRPQHLTDEQTMRGGEAGCPFCAGHERETPHEIIAYGPDGRRNSGDDWQVRVIPNRFPALETGGELERRCDGLYEEMRGVGVHEVIIETPQHLRSTSQLAPEHLRHVLWAYRERLLDLKADRRLVYGMIFKNVGVAAGASLEHTHSQLIATPIVPINVAEELAGSHESYLRHSRCVFCQMIEQELAFGQRIVIDAPGFVAFCPFAARFPFETWIVPRVHASHYETLSAEQADQLARALRAVVQRIEAALAGPDYNYIVHTGPFDTPSIPHYHWHIEVIPRVTKIAGFEWGSGFHINSVSPEAAAAAMRGAKANG